MVNREPNDEPLPPDRVAVVVIHGMGEQKPMETLRGFVETVWERDTSLFEDLDNPPDHRNSDTWSKPDRLSGSAELRRITTAGARDPHRPKQKGVRADFFELHWADLTVDSTWGDFQLWLRGLLLRNPRHCEVPKRVLLVWVLLWLLVAAISISALSLVLAKSEFLKGTLLDGILSWEVWGAITVALVAFGAAVKGFLTSYFGDVARYVSAAPRNIRVRAAARERGLKLLADLTASGKYSRIIVVGHSLGSILAHDLVYLAWSGVVPTLNVGDGSELKRAIEACEAAADALLASAGYAQINHSESSRYERGCQCVPEATRPDDDFPKRLADYRNAQRKLFRSLAKAQFVDEKGVTRAAWLISDLITLGSPLTHAEFLLAKNCCELTAMSRSREILRSPPVLEMDGEDGQLRFSYRPEKTTGPWRIHHAAALAATRWTNIHDESGPLFFASGDLVSGPVSRDFGPGVVDVKVTITRTAGWLGKVLPRLFTHTLYWTYPRGTNVLVPDHVRVLRDGINILDECAVEQRLLNRSGKNDSSLHRTEPEGFGACSAGGAGGKTIWVENLDDSGTGSFRDAVTAKGPRIVKFRVGGIIKLSGPVYVEQGRLTIDGASAMKQGGITLCGQGLVLKGLECRDVIIRHIRVRRSHKNGDCISIAGGAHRILVDHCSVSWADDENFGINQGHNVTVQWCIIAEGLVEGTHDKGSHSCGMLVAHGANHVTVHHNFFAGNNARNALLYGVGGTGTGGAIPDTYPGEDMAVFMPNAVFDFRNNLIYNYRYGAQLGCGMYANVVRNSYRNAPGIPEGSPIYIDKKIYYPGSELPQLWYQGNILLEPQNEGATEREIVCDPDFRSDHPFLTPPVRTHSARQAVTLILKHAGASPRDDVDTRVVEEFHSGMGRIGNGYLD